MFTDQQDRESGTNLFWPWLILYLLEHTRVTDNGRKPPNRFFITSGLRNSQRHTWWLDHHWEDGFVARCLKPILWGRLFQQPAPWQHHFYRKSSVLYFTVGLGWTIDLLLDMPFCVNVRWACNVPRCRRVNRTSWNSAISHQYGKCVRECLTIFWVITKNIAVYTFSFPSHKYLDISEKGGGSW